MAGAVWRRRSCVTGSSRAKEHRSDWETLCEISGGDARERYNIREIRRGAKRCPENVVRYMCEETMSDVGARQWFVWAKSKKLVSLMVSF